MTAPRPPRRAWCAAAALAAVIAVFVVHDHAGAGEPAQRRIPSAETRSGTDFLSPSLRAQSADELANPGMLWVTSGETLWREPPRAGAPSCASCHGESAASMMGVAARYPAVDRESGALLNLELRINDCRTRRQGAPALAWESPDLLGLTTFVAHQSRGVPIKVAVDGPARAHLEAGRALFATRQGQLNLSCAQCHDETWGKRLRGDVISQGHPTGFPIYRLDWQSAGSLQRRLRACSLGVRAEVLDFGAPEYLALELYLAWRAEGLAIETPALRK